MDLEAMVAARPVLRGRLHQLALLVSVVGLVWLVRSATTPRALAAAWIYGVASILLYLTSSSYHVFARSPRAVRIMQRADHSMIFVLIAGSFTPTAVLVLPDPWRWVSLAIMWGGALGGIVFKIIALERFRKVGASLYIILGWAGLMAFPFLARRPATLVLFATGGLLYTVGAIFFALQRPRLSPRWFGYHEVWHAFGVAAGGLLFAANLGLVRAG
ncbi:hemolysin III family protein [Aquihabitans sp. G128]|uniref:PAQR family membrane homeostasis protein TrhA n=1 Tax=Aquihabitans sp. G128 TaxID=2849779 RepID=UPI001C211BC7|nr:hemolysin III family protein [Aquihabitans sp. G128]QXC63062.1 hemolysin III family protein [Aquihabitans sp. G128]